MELLSGAIKEAETRPQVDGSGEKKVQFALTG